MRSVTSHSDGASRLKHDEIMTPVYVWMQGRRLGIARVEGSPTAKLLTGPALPSTTSRISPRGLLTIFGVGERSRGGDHPLTCPPRTSPAAGLVFGGKDAFKGLEAGLLIHNWFKRFLSGGI